MKIAIPTNDRKTLAERTGRAKEFAIFNIENGKITDVKYETNTHEHHSHEEGEEHHEHSHADIVEALKEADILLVTKIGKHMKADLDAGGIKYKKVNEKSIDVVLQSYQH